MSELKLEVSYGSLNKIQPNKTRGDIFTRDMSAISS